MSIAAGQQSAWTHFQAERAFEHALRERRRATIVRRLLRRSAGASTSLTIYDQRTLPRPSIAVGAVRTIPLDAITGTLEPGRAREFDRLFRPSKRTRRRWTLVWIAEQGGTGLPPIDVIQIGEMFAVRDGHHRVSVSRARGAVSIDALVS